MLKYFIPKYISANAHNNKESVLFYLLEKQTDENGKIINIKNNKCKLKPESDKAVKYLLKNGADINFVSNTGNSFLKLIFNNYNSESTLKYFIQKGAKLVYKTRAGKPVNILDSPNAEDLNYTKEFKKFLKQK